MHFCPGCHSSEVVNVFVIRSALNHYRNQRWSRGHKARKAEDTGASVLQKKRSLKKVLGDLKKKGLQTKFSGELKKKVFKKLFQAIYKILTEDRAIFEDLRLRGQGLQNVSSRTPPLMIFPSVEIRQENLSIDRVTNISGNFVEIAGD